MKIFTNIYHYIVFVFILLTVAVLFVFYMQPVALADVELPSNQITGWGWTDTFGWISLNCINVYAGENDGHITDAHCSNSYGVSIDEDTGDISGRAWSTNIGWVDFNPILDSSSGPIGAAYPDTDNGLYEYPVQLDIEIDPETLRVTKNLSGWAVATFSSTEPTDNAWIRFRAGEECVTGPPDAITEDNYCVRLNENGYLAGWAWSGGEDGLGWIYFDETFSGGPYIKTQYSDIYSGGTISGSRAPEGAYNATYCIISGDAADITLSSSQSCLIGDIDIDFPDPTEAYNTAIVGVDLDYLKATSITDNEYYDVGVVSYTIDEFPSNASLDGKVYYFTSTTLDNVDYTINSSLGFSDANIGSGAGTIVVDGDLYINGNMEYKPLTPNNLTEIASVSWVVLGNVYIDKSVTKLVGAFVVLGDGTANSGKLYTGDDELDETPLQLSFSGMVVAKQIVLERTYFTGLAPAEIFEYDGRVLLNTPPGLGNFVGYLPEWSR
ncbi:hypothetical protein ISR92_03070 [Patescibacteria group bacterium]|nr:hypothetical protein [Patescibacteria group bacterium]